MRTVRTTAESYVAGAGLRWGRAMTVAVALGVATALLTSGCRAATDEQGAFVVTFVDVSGSVKDYDVYRDAWTKIVDALQPGDRVLLARISDRTYTRFRPVVDVALPTFDPWRDNRLRHERAVEEQQETLQQALEEAISVERSPQTDILNAVALAEEIFATDNRRPVLVLLSDMVEDSERYNFSTLSTGEALAQRVVSRSTPPQMLPDLDGVRVYVAGATADSVARAREIKAFWKAWFRELNATLVSYGPVLLRFER